MNTWMKRKFTALRSRMVFRLWAIMMVLVMFGIGFMWVVQIFLFEQNYADASLNQALNRLDPVMEDLASEDISKNDKLLPYLSHMNGELFLISEDGKMIEMYSSGHLIDRKDMKEEKFIWKSISEKKEFQNLLDGVPYRYIERHRNRILGFELGFPVKYNGQRCYIIMRNMLMTKTVLDLNRRQLTFLSILLTATAAILAAVLSRQFTRPIYEIKDSVDKLSRNDFSIGPALERDDEFGQLSHSVAELGQALLRVDVLRKEVIANVSHELRSPLALITGYAEMVRDITWQDEAQRSEDLNLIISESNRMSEMVSDILDYSQFQAGYIQLKKDWYNLYDILESEIIHCRQSAAEHSISLELDTPSKEIQLKLDALKISQVVRNLLNNAINHTMEGGRILVRIETDQNRYRVSVANPGTPLSEEDKQVIWERYQRSQHQSGRHSGTGIGLSIVSTILEAHGMPYGIDSTDGWNIFWFQCATADGSTDRYPRNARLSSESRPE